MRPAAVYAKPTDHAQPELLALLHGQWRVATRAVMLLLSLQGWPPSAIAELLGYHPRTVRRWIGRFNQQGTAGLADRPRPGRPPVGSRRLPQRIRRLLTQTQRAWTVPLLYQLGTARDQPADPAPAVRQVAAWRRPRLVAKGDPTTTRSARSCGRRSPSCPLGRWCWPRTRPHQPAAWVRATWIARGARQQVMTPGTNRRRSIFGAVDLQSGRFFYLVAAKAVSATFIAFLEQVAAAYPSAPQIAMVVDNVLIHHSKQVQAWLGNHPQMCLLYGARYSPHDNPVERIWATLKAYLANSPTRTMAGRLRQVHAFFRHRTCQQMLHTAAPHSSPWLPDDYGHNFWKAA